MQTLLRPPALRPDRRPPARASAVPPRRGQDVLLVALLVATAALMVLTVVSAAGPPATTPSAARPVALLVGPTGAGAPFGHGARAVTDRLGWEVDVVGDLGGTYTAEQANGPGDLIPAVRARRDLASYDHIVVSGGQYDLTSDPETLRTAVLHLLDYLRAQARPDTSLTLIGPVPLERPVEPALQQVDEVLRNATADRRIHYISAVEQDWTRDSATLASDTADALAVFLR